MSDLKSKMALLKQEADKRLPPTKQDAMLDKVKEFAESLTSLHPGVEARLETGSIPLVFYLGIAPRHRQFERNLMLIFTWTRTGVRVSDTNITDIAELDAFLLDFYRNPTFQESLALIAARASEDVYGLLMMSTANQRSQHDELFLIRNEVFVALATAPPGSPVTLHVQKEPRFYGRERPFTSAEQVARLRKFRYFGALGYGLEMQQVEHFMGEQFLITGIVQPYGLIH